jgi:hypothetical protein
MADPVLNYPDTPANITARAIRATVFPRRALPTPPPLTVAGAQAQAGRSAEAMAALTPEQRLEIYPQTINAEYLTPMSDLITEGDQEAIDRYGIWINPQVGDEFMRRAAAANLTPPTVTTITGSTTTDNAANDGSATATVRFVVHDQHGAAMNGATLAYTTTGAAVLASQSGTTGTDGSASVNLTNMTAETVTVTATSGGQSGTATATFVAPS